MPVITEQTAAEYARKSHAPGSQRFSATRAVIADAQAVLHKIISGAVRQFDSKGEVIDVPAREIASCAVALDKLIARQLMLSGYGPPKSVPASNEPSKERQSPPIAPVE